MPYVAERISIEDQLRILEDASYEPALRQGFENLRYFTDPRNKLNWVVDRDRGFYLFRSPNFMREYGNEFHFYYGSHMYTIHMQYETSARKAVRVYVDHHQEVANPPQDLKDELTSAFSVHGRWGDGPNNLDGTYNATNAVEPVFHGYADSP